MKHYISLRGSHLSYMKDRAITYSLLCRKRRIAWSGEMEAGDGKLRESMKKLAVKYRLKGKKASLVLDAPVRSAFMTLPGAGPGELEAMARNRLVSEGLCREDALTAVDVYSAEKGNPVHATVYYIDRGKLQELTGALAEAGISCDRVIVRSSCIAEVARLWWKEESVLFAEIGLEHMGIYGLWSGHCISHRVLAMKPLEFIRLQAEDCLWEEMAEWAREIYREMKDREHVSLPKAVILRTEGIGDPAVGAEKLSRALKLPCRVIQPEKEMVYKRNRSSQVYFSDRLIKNRPGGRRNLRLSFGKVYACLFFLNVVIALCLYLFPYFQLKELRHSTDLLTFAAGGAEGADFYGKVLHDETEALLAVRRAGRALSEENGGILKREYIQAISDSLESGMKIDALSYDSREALVEVTLSAEKPSQIPALEERIRSTGIFKEVGHNAWEMAEKEGNTRCLAILYAVLDQDTAEGGQGEP